VWIDPVERFERLELMERGEVLNRRARILSAGLPEHVGKRERKRLTGKLGWEPESASIEEIRESPGPGNIVMAEIECEQLTEVFCGFGKRGLPAEKVADETVEQVHNYLKADVPVGNYLADQMMIPMALAGYGKFRTMQLTRHSTTNLEVINHFLDLVVNIDRQGRNAVEVEIRVSS
jgi:RNA 3'-terminal phosphate cyclase (ATP)